MLAGKTSHQFGAGVARAIVDAQDLRRPTFARRVRKNLFQAGRKPLAFVVGGNNDAVLHEQLRRPLSSACCELLLFAVLSSLNSSHAAESEPLCNLRVLCGCFLNEAV